jgi:hypothetical protein
MLLAEIPSELIYLIAAAAYGVFAWWNDRRQKKALEEEETRRAAEPKPFEPATSAPAAPNSEEERTRRFLEALGVPTNQLPPPPRPAPKPKPEFKPVSPTLAPRPVAAPIPGPMTRRMEPKPTPTRVPVPVEVLRPAPTRRELPPEEVQQPTEASMAMDQVSTDFAQMHARDLVGPTVASAPMVTTGAAPVTVVERTPISSEMQSLRALLTKPESLRTAIVLREILGPPRCLQEF